MSVNKKGIHDNYFVGKEYKKYFCNYSTIKHKTCKKDKKICSVEVRLNFSRPIT